MRFTTRDVLWLMVVVAVACGWWLHVSAVESRHAGQIEEINRDIRSAADYAKSELKRIQDKYKSN